MGNKKLGERILAGEMKEPYVRQAYPQTGWVKVATVVRWLQEGRSVEETASGLYLAAESVQNCRDFYGVVPVQAKVNKAVETKKVTSSTAAKIAPQPSQVAKPARPAPNPQVNPPVKPSPESSNS